MRVITRTKQKPIESTNTKTTNWIFILEAEGLYEEVQWVEKKIQELLESEDV